MKIHKSKKYINPVFLFIIVVTAIFLGNKRSLAAPVVSSVSGTVSAGNPLSINGSGFGSKSPAQPWLYDDFENTAAHAGDSMLNRVPRIGTSRWKYYDFADNGLGSALSYSSAQAYNGTFSGYQSDPSGDAEQDIYIDGQSTAVRYVSYRFRRSGYSGGVWKIDRTTSGTTNNPPYDSPPNFGYGTTAGSYYNDCSAFHEYAGSMILPDADQWHRMETYLVASTNPSVGRIVLWEDYAKQTDLFTATCTSACTACKWDTWMSPLNANHDGNNVYTWIDDIYIDNTLARAEICSASSWGSRANCEIQIPTDWSNSFVSILINQGSFTSGQIVYLYVVDSSGTANSSGFPITISNSSGEVDTTPPTSPTSLSATSPSQSSITVSWSPATDDVGVTGYQVERCLGLSCSNFTQVGTPTASPFTDTGLTASTGYSYHVRAVDAAGNVSGWSNVVSATTQGSPTFSSCSTVTPTNFTDPTYTGYGAPYDVFASNTPLISTQCSSTDTHTLTATLGIPGDTTRIVYTKGYYYDPGINDWTSFTGTCTGALNGEWCQGSVATSITDTDISTASVSDPSYLVGFTCRSQNGSWKCGCRDTSCSNFYWQVQGAGM